MSHDAQFTHAHMVRFDRPLPATPDEVWAVLTDVKRLPALVRRRACSSPGSAARSS